MKIALGVVGLATLGAVFGFARDSRAVGRTVNGTICHGATAADDARLGRSQYGVGNADGSNVANVICPLENLASDEITSAVAIVYDRHSSQDITCTLYRLLGSGEVDITYPPDSDTTSGSGAGTKVLSMSLPDPSPIVPYNYIVACSLPPIGSGGYSHIASIGFD